ncbi:hypothetical protein H2198_006077 [Neophaeococcomyces mojaviensis]|uniref:Uncharacterized protein n=1 Tax=Neophaeococcomyces mojaviensis TaxID=3383035 RepID=A0ACC3A415_9EURO|nr:hypothetical protein H2198_006077 [Knufia sp. JES_112]
MVKISDSFVAASYFKPADVARRVTKQVEEQLRQDHHQALFGGPNPYGMTPTPSSIGSFYGPNPAPLYVVNFKCCRSEIFYIQEGTGLSVQEGDLVIVEADRGTDLGSVQHTHVSWEAARKYKTLYAEQHFQWLMMFSNQSRTGAPNLFNPNAVVPGKGGVNLPGHSSRDGDVKPKLIKRLAQAHEIQALQDKEGNEAKAKRVCQQKVQEHGLNMEILDAEFQMDGKKLTFYFFSTEYINFNSLVTDLFKLYKTRIWMSAINPASFQSPVSQLGLTPIYTNTGMGVASVTNTTNMYDEQRDDNRYFAQAPQHQAQQRAMPQLYYPGYGQAGQMAHVGTIGSGPLTGQVGQANDYGAFAHNYQQPSAPTDPFSNYNTPGYGGIASRPQSMGMARPNTQGPGIQRTADAFADQFNSLSLAR